MKQFGIIILSLSLAGCQSQKQGIAQMPALKPTATASPSPSPRPTPKPLTDQDVYAQVKAFHDYENYGAAVGKASEFLAKFPKSSYRARVVELKRDSARKKTGDESRYTDTSAAYARVPTYVGPASSSAKNLAIIDGRAGGVKEYQGVLSALDRKYSQSEEQIADATAGALKVIQGEGRDDTCINIMRQMLSMPEGMSDYADLVTAYAMIKSKE